jgi:hypothetical protein
MTTVTDRPLLHPTHDPRPIEKAAADSIAATFEPETFLWINFHRPNGGVRIWYAWTTGGEPLGNETDHAALTRGLDAADWLHIGDRHCQHTTRGRIDIQAYPLRPVLADIQAGVRSPKDRRDGLRRVIACAAAETGQTPLPGVPRWLGMGPALLARRTP